MPRARQHLHVASIIPLDGPAIGTTGRFVNTTRPTIGMVVEVQTWPTPETVQPHEYRIVEIRDHRVTNHDTHLLARFVRSGEARPAKAPPGTGQFGKMPT